MRCSWSFAVVALVAVIVTACGPREPGPSEAEFGEVQFWEVAGDGVVTFGDACTDASGFRDEIEPPVFEPNSFLVFKIADDGQSAIVQDCDRVDASTCADSDLDLEFAIDGSTYSAELAPVVRPTADPGCELQIAQLWTLKDEGEALTLTVDLPTTLTGDVVGCAAVEAAVTAEGDNGEGIDGCVVSLVVETTFAASL